MAIIFRKTAKGVHEIETREHRLSLRVRNALILVDGKRDVAALRALVPQEVDGMLDMLLEQAFIEVAAETAASSPSRAAHDERSRSKAPAVAGSPTTAAPVASAPTAAFELRQRAAVRDLNDAIGPTAESLAIRMERARHDADLRPLLHTAVQLIGTARGRSVADAYAKRHGV